MTVWELLPLTIKEHCRPWYKSINMQQQWQQPQQRQQQWKQWQQQRWQQRRSGGGAAAATTEAAATTAAETAVAATTTINNMRCYNWAMTLVFKFASFGKRDCSWIMRKLFIVTPHGVKNGWKLTDQQRMQRIIYWILKQSSELFWIWDYKWYYKCEI